MKPEFVKYPYQLLSLNSDLAVQDYILFKHLVDCHSTKSGFIFKKELQSLAIKSGIGIKKLYRLLSKFKALGFITKENGKLVFKSVNKILINNLNLKTKNKGFEYLPFFKVSTTNIKYLEEIKINHLIHQTSSRYHFHKKANTKADNAQRSKAKNNWFEVSLEKLKLRGSYKSKVTVDRIIDNAIKLSLVNRKKNGMDENGDYYCNSYTTSNYHWTELVTEKPSTVHKKPKTKKTVNRVLNNSELKFRQFVSDYQFELLSSKFIKTMRKLSVRSYPKLLKKILVSNSDLKAVLMGYINPTDISIVEKKIALNQFNSSLVASLPNEQSDRVYGINHVFQLGESELNGNQLESVVTTIRTVRNDYYSNFNSKKTVVNNIYQRLEDFRKQVQSLHICF